MSRQRQLPAREVRDHAGDVVRDAIMDIEGVIDLAAFGERMAFALKAGRYTRRKGVPYFCPTPWLRSIIHGEISKLYRESR